MPKSRRSKKSNTSRIDARPVLVTRHVLTSKEDEVVAEMIADGYFVYSRVEKSPTLLLMKFMLSA